MQEPFNCSGCHANLTWETIQKLIESSRNNDAAGDATWILTSAFIIFTMQSGFGLLEAGKRDKLFFVFGSIQIILTIFFSEKPDSFLVSPSYLIY